MSQMDQVIDYLLSNPQESEHKLCLTKFLRMNSTQKDVEAINQDMVLETKLTALLQSNLREKEALTETTWLIANLS